MDLASLPGGELVLRGLADRAAGRESVESLLLEMASARLRELGFDVRPTSDRPARERLYARLAGEDPRRAHSRINSLERRLVSFERTLRDARRCAT